MILDRKEGFAQFGVACRVRSVFEDLGKHESTYNILQYINILERNRGT